MVDVCYRSPDMEAEDLLGQLEKASFQAQVLMGYLLEGQHSKAEAILEFSGVMIDDDFPGVIIDDDFPTRVTEELAWGSSLLKLMLMNKERLVKDVKVVGSLRCSDQKVVELRI